MLVQLFFRAGSRFENAATNGSTHLLEHVIFRGTDRFPTREALEDALQEHEIDANAYTEREWVSIHLTAPRARLAAALELACEIGFRPRFRDVEVERSIVDAEIRESRVNEGHAWEQIGRLLWGNHPLGFPVAGHRSPATTRQGLRSLHRRFFRPGNSVLVVSGNVEPTSVQRRLRACLRDLEPGHAHLPPPPPARRGPHLKLGNETDRGLRVVFHLQASRSLDDRERLYLWILGRLLEIRLSRVIREDRGACYDLYVDDEFGHELNAISVNAVVRRHTGPMLVGEIFRQLRQLRAEGGEIRDLDVVQSGMIRAYDLLEDDLNDLTDFYVRQTLLSPGFAPLRPADARRMARHVNQETVAAMARSLVGPADLSLVLLSTWTPTQRRQWKERFARWMGDLT